jgi:lysophospholipase L1-like esterase
MAVVLSVLELAARIAGAGDPNAFGGSRLPYQRIYPPLYRRVPAPPVDRWRPRDPRLVDRSLPVSAPNGRVFVFGESAVAALGMSENESFPRALERQLVRAGRAMPVANVGLVAIDSRQVLTCVKDVCQNQHPEVVVLHVGNNEFLELHAQRYIEAHGGYPFQVKLDDAFAFSRLYGTLRNKSIAMRAAALTRVTFRIDDLREGETDVVKAGVGLTREDMKAGVASHLANMRECVETAKKAGARVILMTVATNHEWAHRTDPPGGWLEFACGGKVPAADPERRGALEAGIGRLGAKIADATADPIDRWEARFARGWTRRALGDVEGARDDLARASDEDPHQRRCLAAMNENMRALARETGVTLVDGERILTEASRDGILGFEMLYDYVHFSPEGAERLGAALALAILGDDARPGAMAEVDRRRDLLASRTQDALEVEEYLGWNDDRSILKDRNLWRYENARRKLDDKIKVGTATPEELVWAGNGYALVMGGEEHALELYRRAIELKPELAAIAKANSDWVSSR